MVRAQDDEHDSSCCVLPGHCECPEFDGLGNDERGPDLGNEGDLKGWPAVVRCLSSDLFQIEIRSTMLRVMFLSRLS